MIIRVVIGFFLFRRNYKGGRDMKDVYCHHKYFIVGHGL